MATRPARTPTTPKVVLIPVAARLEPDEAEFVRTTYTSAPTTGHRTKACSACLRPVCFSERWDAFFCPHCNVWLERSCGDRSCELCGSRPARPNDRKRRPGRHR